MSEPGIVIIAIVSLAALYVLLPRVTYILARYRNALALACPETGAKADVAIDASRAAITSAFGRPHLRATQCSFWPGRKGCSQSCLHLPEVQTP
jgi:hypothetical protein